MSHTATGQATGGATAAPHEFAPERRHAALSPSNITLAPGAGRGLSTALLGLGVLGVVGVVVGFFTVSARHALGAWHIGATSVLALSLGGLFFCLLFHLVNAGWTATLRRQYENLASLAPVCGVMVILVPVIDRLMGGPLFAWFNPANATELLLEHKRPYLNEPFYFIRAIAYLALWTYLSRRIFALSREQDRTGDRMLSAQARRMASWGMLLFALSLAFAGFDWLMTIDYRFFSTMWGVYFFAGAAFSSSALIAIVFVMIRRTGKLEGAVTSEHFHDMGKLLFSFTVFWAYIAFSQYFLIWYSNIPEETAFINARTRHGWQYLGAAICIGHFAVPFLVLIFRRVKRTPILLGAIAAWCILFHIADITWIIRPAIYAAAGDKIGLHAIWLDLAGIVGPFGIFGWLLVRKIVSGPLVAVGDPRMSEGLAHKNYV